MMEELPLTEVWSRAEALKCEEEARRRVDEAENIHIQKKKKAFQLALSTNKAQVEPGQALRKWRGFVSTFEGKERSDTHVLCPSTSISKEKVELISAKTKGGVNLFMKQMDKSCLLRELLYEEKCRDEFRTFLETEFASEALEFWEATESLRRLIMQDRPARSSTARVIFKKFIADGAPLQVNISAQLRTETEIAFNAWCSQQQQEDYANKCIRPSMDDNDAFAYSVHSHKTEPSRRRRSTDTSTLRKAERVLGLFSGPRNSLSQKDTAIDTNPRTFRRSLSETTGKKLLDDFEQEPPTPFDAAQREVARSMEFDSLDRFLATPQGRLAVLFLETRGAPLLSGNIFKLKRRGQWVERYAELLVDGLFMYNNSSKRRPSSTVPLDCLLSVQPLNNLCLQEQQQPFHERIFQIRVVDARSKNGKRSLVLASSHFRQEWIDALQRLVTISRDFHENDLHSSRAQLGRSARRRHMSPLPEDHKSLLPVPALRSFFMLRSPQSKHHDTTFDHPKDTVKKKRPSLLALVATTNKSKHKCMLSEHTSNNKNTVPMPNDKATQQPIRNETRQKLAALCQELGPALRREWWKQTAERLDEALRSQAAARRRRASFNPAALVRRDRTIMSLQRARDDTQAEAYQSYVFDPRLAAAPSLFWLVSAAKQGAADAVSIDDQQFNGDEIDDDGIDDVAPRKTLACIKALAVELEKGVRLRVRAKQLWAKLKWNLKAAVGSSKETNNIDQFPFHLRKLAASSAQQFLNVTYFVESLRQSKPSTNISHPAPTKSRPSITERTSFFRYPQATQSKKLHSLDSGGKHKSYRAKAANSSMHNTLEEDNPCPARSSPSRQSATTRHRIRDAMLSEYLLHGSDGGIDDDDGPWLKLQKVLSDAGAPSCYFCKRQASTFRSVPLIFVISRKNKRVRWCHASCASCELCGAESLRPLPPPWFKRQQESSSSLSPTLQSKSFFSDDEDNTPTHTTTTQSNIKKRLLVLSDGRFACELCSTAHMRDQLDLWREHTQLPSQNEQQQEEGDGLQTNDDLFCTHSKAVFPRPRRAPFPAWSSMDSLVSTGTTDSALSTNNTTSPEAQFFHHHRPDLSVWSARLAQVPTFRISNHPRVEPGHASDE